MFHLKGQGSRYLRRHNECSHLHLSLGNAQRRCRIGCQAAKRRRWNLQHQDTKVDHHQ